MGDLWIDSASAQDGWQGATLRDVLHFLQRLLFHLALLFVTVIRAVVSSFYQFVFPTICEKVMPFIHENCRADCEEYNVNSRIRLVVA